MRTGRIAVLALLLTLVATMGASHAAQQPPARAAARTRVIILGVDHSIELVSPGFSPGMVTAFIREVAPAALCIERPPEYAARNDYYEFTYEVQGIALPYAAQTATPICPVDWMPSVSDQKLVFGSDLDVPPPLRPATGYQSFLTFPDRAQLSEGLFYYDRPASEARVVHWANTPPERADQDFPRRLYLYRTYMQAENIRAVARAYRGRTILVIIGYFHKPGLEAILSHDPNITLVKASTFKVPGDAAADNDMTEKQRVAILSFNLLGRQSETHIVNWPWMEQILDALAAQDTSPEVALFKIRYRQLRGDLSGKALLHAYNGLLNSTPPNAAFSWNGVKDDRRLDSYFDPFGNLTVRQRIQLEYTAALAKNGEHAQADRLFHDLASQLDTLKAWQLDAYAARYGRIP